jgi:hypothetical protein
VALILALAGLMTLRQVELMLSIGVLLLGAGAVLFWRRATHGWLLLTTIGGAIATEIAVVWLTT